MNNSYKKQTGDSRRQPSPSHWRVAPTTDPDMPHLISDTDSDSDDKQSTRRLEAVHEERNMMPSPPASSTCAVTRPPAIDPSDKRTTMPAPSAQSRAGSEYHLDATSVPVLVSDRFPFDVLTKVFLSPSSLRPSAIAAGVDAGAGGAAATTGITVANSAEGDNATTFVAYDAADASVRGTASAFGGAGVAAFVGGDAAGDGTAAAAAAAAAGADAAEGTTVPAAATGDAVAKRGAVMLAHSQSVCPACPGVVNAPTLSVQVGSTHDNHEDEWALEASKNGPAGCAEEIITAAVEVASTVTATEGVIVTTAKGAAAAAAAAAAFATGGARVAEGATAPADTAGGAAADASVRGAASAFGGAGVAAFVGGDAAGDGTAAAAAAAGRVSTSSIGADAAEGTTVPAAATGDAVAVRGVTDGGDTNANADAKNSVATTGGDVVAGWAAAAATARGTTAFTSRGAAAGDVIADVVAADEAADTVVGAGASVGTSVGDRGDARTRAWAILNVDASRRLGVANTGGRNTTSTGAATHPPAVDPSLFPMCLGYVLGNRYNLIKKIKLCDYEEAANKYCFDHLADLPGLTNINYCCYRVFATMVCVAYAQNSTANVAEIPFNIARLAISSESFICSLMQFNNVLFPTLRVFIENGSKFGEMSVIDIQGNDPELLLEICVSGDGCIKEFKTTHEMLGHFSNLCKIVGIDKIHTKRTGKLRIGL